MPKRPSASAQLDLFPPEADRNPAPAANVAEHRAASRALDARFERLAELAARLPSLVRFGTSSWSFPGWANIVYEPGLSESLLAREGLRAYVRHPLLRTVGIDRGYYAPLRRADFQRYASQLPPAFPCCAKVPALFATPVHLGHDGHPRGTPNPLFLDAQRFIDDVVEPAWSEFRSHTGPLILEFPPLPRAHRLSPASFDEQLDRFLTALPKALPMAVELRDDRLLTTAYARVLARHGASHVYSYWTAMPMPAAQARVVPLDNAPFVVLRLMLRPGTRYDDRKNAFAPFDRIVDPNPDLRAEVAALLRSCADLQRAVFVLVNNKAEGSAPLTIEAIAASLAGA